MKKGIIFDLDGTLWDACAKIAESWNICVEEKMPQLDLVLTEEDLRGACGLTMTAIGNKLFPMVNEPQRGRLTEACCDFEVEYLKTSGGQVYDGLEQTLKKLKDEYSLYIVSNCQDGYIECFLEWSRLGSYFDDTECFGRTGQEKDRNIVLLKERNGLDKAIYVGDTATDKASADLAGVPFVHAAYGFGSVDTADAVISDISQLPEAAAKLLSD